MSQWWIGGLRTRKAKVAGSIPAGGSTGIFISLLIARQETNQELLNSLLQCHNLMEGVNFLDTLRTQLWTQKYEGRPPRAVAIETTTWCNRSCSYCPNSISPRGEKEFEKKLEQDTHTSIIESLHEMRFKGKLSYQFYGEPLLDSRLEVFVKEARSKLDSKVKITFSTNGDLLNLERLHTLYLNGVNWITLSIHDEEPKAKLIELLQRLDAGNYKTPEIRVKPLKEFKQFFNRGGLVSVPEGQRPELIHGCDKATHMQIDAMGNVVLCCNDFFSENILGEIEGNNLSEIWQRSEKLRKKIFLGEYALDICKKCVGMDKSAKAPLPLLDIQRFNRI